MRIRQEEYGHPVFEKANLLENGNDLQNLDNSQSYLLFLGEIDDVLQNYLLVNQNRPLFWMDCEPLERFDDNMIEEQATQREASQVLNVLSC